MNMIKVIASRFGLCLGTFTMLLLEGSSETKLFRHLCDYVFGVRNFGNKKVIRVIFFFKTFRISARFEKCSKKLWKSFLFLRQLHLNWYRYLVSFHNTTLFISSQRANKQSQDLACQKERLFPTQLTWQWSMNMIKTRWCRSEPCSGTFTMLLLEGSSETGLFRHLSNHVFRVRNFGNTKAVRVVFCPKMFKI